MRKILSIGPKPTKNKSELFAVPNGSDEWTWNAVADLPQGEYLLVLGDLMDESEAEAQIEDLGEDPTSVGIVRHSISMSKEIGDAWRVLVESQRTEIAELRSENLRLRDGQPAGNGGLLGLLGEIAPLIAASKQLPAIAKSAESAVASAKK